MPTVERHEIDIMQAQSIIASLCADIELTKQICQINHKKFGLDTKICWVLPTDADNTKLAINQLLFVNGYNETYMANRELKTVGDAFRFISMISIYALWANDKSERMQKCSLGHLVNGAGIGFSCADIYSQIVAAIRHNAKLGMSECYEELYADENMLAWLDEKLKEKGFEAEWWEEDISNPLKIAYRVKWYEEGHK